MTLAHLATLSALAQDNKKPRFVDPDKTDADFVFQGEYSGELGLDEKTKFGVQVIANGNGRFSAAGFPGGLPGDGFDGEKLAINDGVG